MRFVQTPDDLPDRDTILSMSGLDFMFALQNGDIAAPAIYRVMNYRLDSVAPGKVTFRGSPTLEHLNPVGTTHGGWFGTLLDSCMGCAVMTVVPKGSTYTTLEYKVNLTRGIAPGTEVIATGTIDHAGRSTGVATGRITDAQSGKLYATATTTCLIMT